MSLFGKILAVLNVLAAIAFLVLAGMGYSKRHNWSYQHFRHQVAIYGLPVTNSDDDWRLPGRTVADDLSQATVTDIFSQAGGAGVKTQVEAVQQALTQIQSEINGAADDRGKKAVIAAYLLPLAKTSEDRELYQQYVRDASKPASTLQQQLEGLIGYAVSETEPPPSNATRGLDARRRAIADLLYNMNPDANAAWHKRVMTIVGLQHYIGAADRQAANLQEIAFRLNTAIADEQSTFVRQYQSLLPELQLLHEQVKDLDARLKEQLELVQKHTVLRNARQTEVAEFQKQFQDAKSKVAEDMTTLQGLQKQLFALQQTLATAQAKNVDLERELRSKESGR